MTMKLRPHSGVQKISAYVGGASKIAGQDNVVKLSSNENPYGPSPRAIEAIRQTAPSLHRYPDGAHYDLRVALARVHDLPPEQIICGAGSDEIFSFLAQAYGGPGTEMIHTEHGFAMYPIVAHACGARPISVAEKNRHVDIEAILAAVNARTRIVFIANPANPTGTMISDADLAQLAKALPPTVLLVLDGAYAEYAPGYDGGASLVAQHENVIMTRTFSKLYGLGGLRVGWAYGAPAVIDALNRVRGPFNLGQLQMNAAIAALDDRAHVAHSLSENARLRALLASELASLGIPSDPSFANFILARFADQSTAEGCEEHLRMRGLLVRKTVNYGLPSALRISIGNQEDCERVHSAVAEFMKQREQRV